MDVSLRCFVRIGQHKNKYFFPWFVIAPEKGFFSRFRSLSVACNGQAIWEIALSQRAAFVQMTGWLASCPASWPIKAQSKALSRQSVRVMAIINLE